MINCVVQMNWKRYTPKSGGVVGESFFTQISREDLKKRKKIIQEEAHRSWAGCWAGNINIAK